MAVRAESAAGGSGFYTVCGSSHSQAHFCSLPLRCCLGRALFTFHLLTTRNNLENVGDFLKKFFLPMKYRKECLGECEYPSVILFDHLALHAVYFEGGNIKKFSTLI